MIRFREEEIRAENNLIIKKDFSLMLLFIYLFSSLLIHRQGEATVVANQFPNSQSSQGSRW